MMDDQVFDINNIPEDAEVFSSQSEFDDIDPSQMYTLEVAKVELRQNPFWKPDEKDPEKQSPKYQFAFEYFIIEDNEFYGRRIWDQTTLAFKPDGPRGPTKLHKIVTAALKIKLDWEEGEAYAPDTKTLYKNLIKDIVGKQVKVAIENVKKEGKKTRTKIVAYHEVKTELPAFDIKKMEKVAAENKAKKKAAKATDGDKKPKEDDIPF